MWSIPFSLFKKRKLMFGIDVSHFQGTVDWALAKSQIDFAYIKCSEGQSAVDSMFMINAINANKSGVPIGYYHFATLNSEDVLNDARNEANFFVQNVKKVPAPNLPLVLDIELNKANLDKDEVLSWINTFFRELEVFGYKDSVLYSYTPFLNANLPRTHNLGNTRLWLAAYVNKQTPLLPNGWKDYWLWQYSAKGTIAGVKTSVDLNKSNQSIA